MPKSLFKALLVLAVATASIFLFVNIGRTASSPLIISEFRFRGPNGADHRLHRFSLLGSNLWTLWTAFVVPLPPGGVA